MKQKMDEFASSIRGWPAVVWGLILGTGSFTFLILSFMNTTMNEKVQASESRMSEYLQGRKEVRDTQYKAINDSLTELKESNKKIYEHLIRGK